MGLRFTKLHGAGNDYVYVDCFQQSIADPAALARTISDRHFGVGSDGLILLLPSEKADCRMRMFNADGSEGQMCGNGIRCLAKFAYELGRARKNPMTIETGRGILTLQLQIDNGLVRGATVDMLEPILNPPQIPVILPGERIVDYPLTVEGSSITVTAVSMGSPHVTWFVEDVSSIDLPRIGPVVEHLPIFPQRINFHVAQIISPTEIRMRSWERGSGITLACGTGACAVLVAAVLTGRASRKALIHLPGGDLQIDWTNNHVFMTGPAEEVFHGDWEIAADERR